MEKEIDAKEYYNINFTDEESIIFVPKTDNIKGCLIWLPGFKDKAYSYYEDVLDKRRFIPLGFKLIILTADKVIKDDDMGYSWYKTVDRSKGQIEPYENGLSRILSTIESEGKELGYNKVFLGGFSQGCLMSFLIGLNYHSQLGGLVCCSGYMSNQTIVSSTYKNFPIIICQGVEDDIIPCDYAYKSYSELFSKDNLNVTYKKYKFKHELTWEEYADIKKFLENNLS